MGFARQNAEHCHGGTEKYNFVSRYALMLTFLLLFLLFTIYVYLLTSFVETEFYGKKNQ
jgi:hypothetical protein